MKIILHSSLAALAVFMLSSCSHQSATKILSDPKQRPEIFNAICADPQLLTELSDQISKSDPAMQALVSSKELMRVMHTEKHMGSMMRNDSSMANIYAVNLMNLASEDTSLRREIAIAVVKNDAVRTEVKHLMHDPAKDGKEKKHKEHKEKKEKKEKKKGKHSKKD
jgi:hypothetical protein